MAWAQAGENCGRDGKKRENKNEKLKYSRHFQSHNSQKCSC